MLDAIASQTVPQGECLLWTGSRRQDGYGLVRHQGKQYRAHRFVYEQTVGPIPANHHLHHTCENPACVNIAHLQAIPNTEHVFLGQSIFAENKKKAFCKHGHSLENAWVRKSGERQCRTCNAIRQRETRRRRAGNSK